MRPKRPKLYEDEPEENSLTIGSYNSFQTVPKDDVPKKPQIGFIRTEKKKRPKRK